MIEDLLPADEAELARLVEADAARAAVPLAKWPRQLVELLDASRAALLRGGVQADEADRLARITMQAIAELHGGRSFNLPKGNALKNALRNDVIWVEMGKTPVEDLARRFDITIQRIYQIYADQRAMRRKRQQTDLF